MLYFFLILQVCSGSWDGSIKLWNVGDETEDDLVIKKRKVHKFGADLNEESQLEVHV